MSTLQTEGASSPTQIKTTHLSAITPEEAQAGLYSIDRLSQTFAASARRWEMIVYPSLFAFLILAAYGFYLVFSLTRDMHYLAYSVDANMTVMASNIQTMTENVAKLSDHIRVMSVHVESMSRDTSTLEPMLTAMKTMDQSIQSMAFTTHDIRDNFGVMNRNISRPLNFFMPW